MGDIVLREENGKTVAYEKGIFGDVKVGECYKGIDGSLSTYDGKVVADSASRITGDRDATVNGVDGVFSKGFLDKEPTFKAKK